MPYGVSEQVLAAYGAIIIELSLNKQVRRGDPIRHLDVETWQRERSATGLSDAEIAARIGLAAPQVTFIRNIVERRLFRANQYRKLFSLGGGKRYSPGTSIDPEQALAVGPQAEELRRALTFDPRCVTRYVGEGLWTPETLTALAGKHAGKHPDNLALKDGHTDISWRELGLRIAATAAHLADLDVGRGEVVGVELESGSAPFIHSLGAIQNGNVVLPIASELDPAPAREPEFSAASRASIRLGSDLLPEIPPRQPNHSKEANPPPAYIAEILKTEINFEDESSRHSAHMAAYGVSAGDPAIVIPGGDGGALLVPHTHHTLVANARDLTGLFSAGIPKALGGETPEDPLGFSVLLALWIYLGVPLILDGGERQPSLTSFSIGASDEAARAGSHTAIFALKSRGTKNSNFELLLTPETLACLFRRSPQSLLAGHQNWSPLASFETRIQETGRGELEMRGPSVAPGHVGDDGNSAHPFGAEGWVRTRLIGFAGQNKRVLTPNPDRAGP